MAARKTWALAASLIFHLALVFFVGAGLVPPARQVSRIAVDLQGTTPRAGAGPEAPVLSRPPALPAAKALPVRPSVALQMALPPPLSVPRAPLPEPDNALRPPPRPVLPAPPVVALTRPGGAGAVAGADRKNAHNTRGAGRQSALKGYLAAVRRQVDAAKRYPRIAQQRRLQGNALIAFSLSASGELLGEPRLLRSSGYSQLDREALGAVRRGAPYPEFPGKPKDMPGVLQVEIYFVLKDTEAAF